MTRNGLLSAVDKAISDIENQNKKQHYGGLPASLLQTASEGDVSVKSPASTTNNSHITFENVPFKDDFIAASNETGAPINVLMALTEQESNFKPDAIGVPTQWGQAKGILQYLDSTASGMNIDPFNPKQSINAAGKQLTERLRKGYTLEEAIAAHFGGDDRRNWGPKTKQYVRDVMSRIDRFTPPQQAIPEEAADSIGSNIETRLQQDYPHAKSGMENLDMARQRNDARYRAVVDLMNDNAGEKGRYRALTEQEQAQMGNENALNDPQLPKAFSKGKDARSGNFLTDTGLLLWSGITNSAGAVRELMKHYVPFGEKVVTAIDRADKWIAGKDSEALLKDSEKAIERGWSQEMLAARKKDFVNEDKDGNHSFGPAWSDPRAYYSAVVESLPETALTMGAAGRLAKFAYTRAIKSGLGRAVAAKRAATTATIAGSVIEGGMGGAHSSKSVREDILKMTPQELSKSEAMKDLMANGKTFEQARAELADDSATKAFFISGFFTGIFGGQGDRALAKIITNHSGSRIKSAMLGAIGEGLLEEAPQSAAQQMSENYAKIDANPDQRITQGVANQIVSGAVAGGIMGAGMGAAAPHVSDDTSSSNQQPDIPPSPAPKGPLGRAMKDTMEAHREEQMRIAQEQTEPDAPPSQPVNDESNMWLGQPGELTYISPASAPDMQMEVTVEGYTAEGDVLVRSGDGNLLQVGQDEIIFTPPAKNETPPQPLPGESSLSQESTRRIVEIEDTQQRELQDLSLDELNNYLEALSQQAKISGWKKPLRHQRKRLEAVIEAKKRETTVNDSELSQPVSADDKPQHNNEPALLDKTSKTEDSTAAEVRNVAKSEREPEPQQQPVPPQKADEARQLPQKSQENVVNTQGNEDSAVTPSKAATKTDPSQNKDGSQKWFGTHPKAQDYLDRLGINDTHEIRAEGRRFEIRAKKAEAAVTPTEPQPVNQVARVKKTNGPRANRARKLLNAEIGDTIIPNGNIGYIKANRHYKIEAIEKSGVVHVTNLDTGGSTTLSLAELEQANSLNVNFGQIQNETGTATASNESADKSPPTSQRKTENHIAKSHAAAVEATEESKDTLTAPIDGKKASPQQNRARKLMQATIGDTITPSEAIVAMQPGQTYSITGIGRNGVITLKDAKGNIESVSVSDLEEAHSRGIGLERVALTNDNIESPIAEKQPRPEKDNPQKDTDRFADNTLFTAERVAAARARMKKKLGQLNSGVDPELLIDGMTIAGAYIESGVRKFGDYAKAMVDDFGGGIKPYLLSFWEGARNYPGLDTAGMTSVSKSAEEHQSLLSAEDKKSSAVGLTEEKSIPRSRKITSFDDMVKNFDEEVTANESGKLDFSSKDTLAGASASDVQPTRAERATRRSAQNRSNTDRSGNGGSGERGVHNSGSVGTNEGDIPVSASGNDGGRRERSRSTNAGSNGDNESALLRRGIEQDPASGNVASRRATAMFTLNPDTLGKGGKKTKFKNNLAAIETLVDLAATGKPPTREQQETLAHYVGWGGIPEAFQRTDGSASKGWEKEVAQLRKLLKPEEYLAAANSSRNAHYTSAQIVTNMWAAMQRMGLRGGKGLEPSVGTGNFLGLMPKELRKNARFIGVELDPITAKIANYLYPAAHIVNDGFQNITVPPNSLDFVVGNPPFGAEKLHDRHNKQLSKFSIHNYFIAKSIDGLRPGGLAAFVVTHRMMDSASDTARQYINKRADLIGAIRLPNDAFADNAGTEVTTDILFFRKRDEDEEAAGQSWSKIVDYTDSQGKTVPLNEYFIRNPENMLGEFGAYGSMYREDDSALVKRDGQNTNELLQQAIARLPEQAMSYREVVSPENVISITAESVREGSMYLDGDRIMIRGPEEYGSVTSTEYTPSNQKMYHRIKDMIGIRDSLQQLRQLQLSREATDAELDKSRCALNRLYDAFVKENGYINADANKRIFRDDPTWPQISALEDNYDKGVSPAVSKNTGEAVRKPSAKKAAIFSQRTQMPYKAPEVANSAKDALLTSLSERGRVDLSYMSKLYNKPEDEVITELGDRIFNDPEKGYVTREEYLSGNVKRKLATALKAAEKDKSFASNIIALKAAQPHDVEAVDINVKPGATWIPESVMNAFADHIGENPGSKTFYNPVTAKWVFQTVNDSVAARTRWATSRMTLKTALEHIAAQKSIEIYDEGPLSSRVLNETETQLANDKLQKIRQEWDNWLFADDTRRKNLTRLYNDQFNTNVERTYDGSHLKLPGKISDDVIKLRPHQLNAVWRWVQNGRILMDHVVGAGKTYTIIAGIMELRRLQLANKPMLTVPNHLVGQWATDFIRLYPNAKVLAATKRDFEATNRKRLVARITTGDWDVIILPHSSFGRVGVSPETEAAFIEEQIKDLEISIELLKTADGREGRNVKDAAKRRVMLEERLKKLLDQGRKDDAIYWDEIGIDALAVDEAHEFKNLAYSTTMRNVAGLSNATGSQKAMDMFMKVHLTLKATGGRNVAFATGTPISNTMAEMYTMQRYLDYDNLSAQGLAHFDAWARMYGEVVTDWELSPSGKYKLNSRFAKFVNMPELMQSYTSFADVISRDDINRQLADQGKRLPVPKLRGGKPEIVVVERSYDQANFIGIPTIDENGIEDYPDHSLVYRSEHLPKKPVKGADNMLKIMSDARKAALDMRLINPSSPDFPGSKIHVAANRIRQIYGKWNADKGTQLVFIDLSTPKGAKGKESARLRNLVEKAESGDITAQEQLDKLSPDELTVLDESNFSVYDDLKQKLIDRGIPENEIAFIHDANTDLQKEELFNKVRSGRIRVLLGSTAKMGAGMNVQNRLVAAHHLDAPWRPSDLEQRDGRIERQGNELYTRDPNGFEIEIIRYATKQTLDSRMWQTIESKARFIEQVRKGNTGVREIEDIGGEAANAAEMKAASSGNPLILEEMTLRSTIRRLKNERSGHVREQHRVRDMIAFEKNRIKNARKRIIELQDDTKLVQPNPFSATINSQVFDKRTDAGAAIIAIADDMDINKTKERQIGHYGGFSLHLFRDPVGVFTLELAGKGSYSVDFNTPTDSTGLAMRMTNAVKNLDKAITAMEDAQYTAEAAIPKLESQIQKWEKADELEDLETRHDAIIEELRPKRKAEENSDKDDNATTTAEDDIKPSGAGTGLDKPAFERITGAIKSLSLRRDSVERETYVNQQAALLRRLTAPHRGDAQRILADMQEQAKAGAINSETLAFASWMLQRFPHAAHGLQIDFVDRLNDSDPAGRYYPAQRLVEIFRDNNSDIHNPSTVVHEILHHMERMLPPNAQRAIVKEWELARKKAMREGSRNRARALDDLMLGTMTGDKDALHRAMNAFTDGTLQSIDYQLANPSEYWAENASEILHRRAQDETQRAWLGALRRFVRAVIGKLRSLFQQQSGSAINRALDAVLAGDGHEVTTDMIRDTTRDNSENNYFASYGNLFQRDKTHSPQSDIDDIRSWWQRSKEWTSDKVTTAMPKTLALVPFRPLVQELAKSMPSANIYLRHKQAMDTMRNNWHAKTDAVAQKWLKYRVNNREENRELMSLMHESTREQVDPSQPFISLMTQRDLRDLKTASMGTAGGNVLLEKSAKDQQRRIAYARLKSDYDKLSPAAKSLFNDVRDTYTTYADTYEQTIIGNMEKALDYKARRADHEYEDAKKTIRDEGLKGDELTAALREAEKAWQLAKTKVAWNNRARITQLRTMFETNRVTGPYFPLQRFGQFFVTVRMKDTGKVESFSRFENASDMNKFARIAARQKNVSIEKGTLDDTTLLRRQVDAQFVADVEDILATVPNSDEVRDQVWQRYLETLPDASVRVNRIHRKGRKGFDADALRAFSYNMFHGSHQLARLKYTTDLVEALENTEREARRSDDPVRNGLVVNEMNKRHQFIMNPSGGRLAQAVTTAAFIYHLSVTPAAAIVNTAQTVVMGIPILGNYAGGATGMVKANVELMRAMKDFSAGRGWIEQNTRLTAEERAAMKAGYETGVIDRTQSHDLAGVGETGVEYSAMRTKLMGIISWAFHNTERMNREITYIAAYRLARNKGVTQAEAITAAGDLTWKTHFDYQNTSRPRAMQSDAKKMLLVFRNFQVNMLWRLFRDTHQAINAKNPAERQEAVIQLAGITGMMMLNAGIRGTWLFGIAMMLAGMFMDDDKDPEQELKKGMVNTLGPTVAGLALDGIPGYVTGTSLSERIGMPDLWFRSPTRELEGREEYSYWQSQMLGAAPSLIENIYTGLNMIGKGQTYRGVETMLPKFAKDAMKAYRYATDGVRNLKGDQLVDDVSIADIFKQAVGFAPAKINEQYAINSATMKAQKAIIARRSNLLSDVTRAIEKDDNKKENAAWVAIDKFNDDYPEQQITPKSVSQSLRAKARNRDDASNGIIYNRKLKDRLIENQSPAIYQ